MDKMISVIIPMYNTESYIEECIQSLMDQTYINFEVFIIDDGSTDKSFQIAADKIKSDKRFNLIKQDNMGASTARNKGIMMSKGFFLYFLDSDDYIHKTTFEKCMREFEEKKVDLVIFDAICIVDKVYLNKKQEKYEEKMSNFYDRSSIPQFKNVIMVNDFLRISFLENKFRGNSVLYMIKRNIITKNNIMFNEKITYYEDVLFLYKVIKHIKKVKYLSHKFYYRRLTGNSLMTSNKNIEIVNDVIQCIDLIRSEGLNEINKMFIKYLSMVAYVFWNKCSNVSKNDIKLTYYIKILFESLMVYTDEKDVLEASYNDNIIKIMNTL
ncbi:glycosyl transferase family 2 [Natranaerovirga pectinivora]|uniref:Glycosyl transferase family 2 n=1 Tax=Natranaerovirga pectinivora TaxID=682400 RepID=A0A4R3MPB7_9FIRM|nr:glycosyltransferase family A protein [Natranaerovirga pectinivora]TCT14028.1 glycosyl transferase family 2 [Natranaerovirga pectinivora]